jgi:neurotransmitter:Na+ symporter, NSS family
VNAPESPSRGSWATQAGFVLAAIGSAVGLGNMWRFAYKASEGGGAAFVVVYIVFVLLVGMPLMTSEFVIGRLTQESPARALRRLGGSRWAPLGWLFVLCGLGILAYYSVIAGWTMRYAIDALRNAIPSDTSAYFSEVATGWDAVGFHVAFMVLTIVIVAGGIKGGIERGNLIMMPLLFLILIGLAIWATTLPGGGPGYAYYLRPQLSAVFTRDTLTRAAGQSFFSLSLGMGALMTYASYLRSKTNLGREAMVVALADTGVAFTAGLIVFPLMFAFGLQDRITQIGESTVGALFITLPVGFEKLGRVGDYVDSIFFVMLFFAALTSAISLLEVVVAALVDGFHWTRAKAAWISGAGIAALGIPAAFNTTFLGNMDLFVGNFLLILGGLFTALFVGYKLLPQAQAELAQGMKSSFTRNAWAALVRYVAPVVLVVVIVFLARQSWDALVGLVTFAR